MGDRSSRLVAPPDAAPKLGPDEIVKLEAENGLRQADRMYEIIDHAVASRKFRLRPSTLIELNRIAVSGLVSSPGVFRVGEMVIEQSEHKPPPAQDVPGYVDDLCDYVAAEWASSYPSHLAAYVLWRLNWIHPFEDGNGRTARAASYIVLSAKIGSKLPGTRSIPEVIAADKKPYYAALESADSAWKSGKLDLHEVEDLLQSCLASQLLDVVQKSGPNSNQRASSAGTSERNDTKSGPAASPIVPQLQPATKPRVFIGSSSTPDALNVAGAIQVELEYGAEPKVWNQSVFGPSAGTLEALQKATQSFDFAVLVFTPDDRLVSGDSERPTARDNVVFELGLFMGTFGRHRTFIVHPRDAALHLPTDLAGITALTYDPNRSDRDIQAAVGPACTKIKRAIRDQGSRT